MIAISVGTAVGVNALLSRQLGEKKFEAVNRTAGNGILLALLSSAVFIIFGLFGSRLFFSALTEDAQIAEYGVQYTQVVTIFCIGLFLQIIFERILQATGRTIFNMISQTVGAVTNIIMDPILIFGFDMGIKGAAIATVVCQLAALLYTFKFFSDKTRLLHFTRPVLQIDRRIAGQCFAIGMGPFLMNAASSIIAMMINQQLAKYGSDMAIGAYGIVNRVTIFFIMICMGFNQGLQPIAGYNYGARLYHRVREVFFMTVKWEVLVTTLCFLVSMVIPRVAVGLFTNDSEMIDMASKGLRVMNICVAIVGFNIVAGNLFQCLGMVRTAIVLSLSRQLLCLLPFLYLLPMWFGIKGVWISFPVADLVSTVVAVIFVVRLMRKFDRLRDGEDSSILGSAIK